MKGKLKKMYCRGDTRTVHKFAWLPTRVIGKRAEDGHQQYVWVWLEHYKETQEYCNFGAWSDRLHWCAPFGLEDRHLE